MEDRRGPAGLRRALRVDAVLRPGARDISGLNRRDLFRGALARPSAPRSQLSDEEIDRYSRQLVLPGWGEEQQVRLRRANALVVGAGALGAPVATYLAGAGIGTLGIVDGDRVATSNLHRQHLHLTPDVGAPKVSSAATKLRLLNPAVLVEEFPVRLEDFNAAPLVAGHDVVVDCSDSFETRYLVNAACCKEGVALVEGGVVGLTGIVMTIRPGQTACYRCAFPEAPAGAPSCAEAGILGPAAGVVGSLMALEAMRVAAGLEGLADAFLQVDLHDHTVTRVAVSRRADCADCQERTP